MTIDEMIQSTIIGLITGLISGCISGFLSGLIVYFLTKRKERKYQAYRYWHRFLFDALGRFGLTVPVDSLDYITDVGDANSDWYKAVRNIIDCIDKSQIEDRELTEEENQLADNIQIAMKELTKWAKANRLNNIKL